MAFDEFAVALLIHGLLQVNENGSALGVNAAEQPRSAAGPATDERRRAVVEFSIANANEKTHSGVGLNLTSFAGH